MGVLTLIIDAFAWVYAFFSLLIGTLISILYFLVDLIVNKLLFSLTGRIILGTFILALLGVTITNTHSELFQAIDQFYCEIEPLRNIITSITEVIAPLWEQISCFYNLIVSAFRTALFAAVPIIIECDAWQDVVRAYASFLQQILWVVLDWLTDPLNNEIEILSLWIDFTRILQSVENALTCLCEDLDFFFVFVIDLLRNNRLLCFIDGVINGLLKFAQGIIKGLFFGNPLEFTQAFQRLCLALNCLGEWIDFVIAKLINLFAAPIDLNLGCILAKAACIVLDLVQLILDFLINSFGMGFAAFFSLDFDPLINRVEQLGDCIENFFGLINACLGQTVGNLVKFVASLIDFLIVLFQNGNFNLQILINGLNRFLGRDQYGPSATHISFSTSERHTNPKPQSSLTCLLAQLLGNGTCSRAFGDLVNAVANLILVPFLIIEEILDSDFSGVTITGNPLDSATRDEFNDIILEIICVVTDRILIALDYIGHQVGCIPGLGGIGNAIVDLTAALDVVIDEVKDILLLIIELIVQLFVWLLSFFGASPFSGRNTGDETITFFSILLDLILTVLSIIAEIFIQIVNLILFPWFPALFGQNTLYQENPGTATFTECFSEFGDCICGITKSLANLACLPLNLGCLGDVWPGCGDFDPTRKRFVAEDFWSFQFNTTGSGPTYMRQTLPLFEPDSNYSVWEYWADHFGDTICGNTFERWRYGPPESLTEIEASQYLGCIGAVYESLYLAQTNITGADGDLFVNPEKMSNSLNSTTYGLDIMLSSNLLNAGLYFTSPTELLSDPFSTIEYYNPTQIVRDMGVEDPLALFVVDNTQEAINTIYNSVSDAFSKTNYTQDSLKNQTVEVVNTAWTLTKSSVSVGLMTLQEINNFGVIPKFADGFSEMLSAVFENAVNTTASRNLQKRNEEYINPVTYTLNDNGTVTLHTEKSAIIRHNLTKAFVGFSEYGNALLGNPSPRLLEISEDNHLDLTCVSVGVGCTPIGTMCNAIELFSVYSICNEFFGYGLVVGCDGDQQAITLYTDTTCNNSIATLQASGNETSCAQISVSGAPQPITVCIRGDACVACPTEQVFPNFKCSWLDEVVHRMTLLTQRCIQKLAPPRNPITISTPSPTPFISPTPVPTAAPTTILEPTCGNSVLDFGEQCDDGNRENGDGCNSACQLERCGNGIVQAGEQCDDGNRIPGDGCDENCRFEFVCGNGVLEPFSGEECDDGNTDSNDGCSSDCKLEKCPSVIFDITPESGRCDINPITGDKPVSIFNGISQSVTVSCIPNTPILWRHDGLDGFGAILETVFIENVCSAQPGVCLLGSGSGENCDEFVSVGTDFTCTQNCGVCGDGIINGDEECDDGTVFGSDNCIACRRVCQCSPNPTLPCFGECFGGVQNGQPCNPRLDVESNVAPENITYTADFFDNKVLVFTSIVDNEVIKRCQGCIELNNVLSGDSLNSVDTDTSRPFTRFTAEASGFGNSVYLRADTGRYIVPCSSCIVGSICSENELGGVAVVSLEPSNLSVTAAWNIIQIQGNTVAIQNFVSGLYLNEIANEAQTICVDALNPLVDSRAQWNLDIVGVGTECSDGGGVCGAISCCGDGIYQSVSIPTDSKNPYFADRLGNIWNEGVYIESNLCEEGPQNTPCLACMQTLCECVPAEVPYGNGNNLTFVPCAGRCFQGPRDGKKCLAYPPEFLADNPTFALDRETIEALGYNDCRGDPLPGGIRGNDGICMPISCCGDGEVDGEVNPPSALPNDFTVEELCDHNLNPSQTDVSCSDTLFSGCTWDCGLLFQCSNQVLPTPTPTFRKRSHLTLKEEEHAYLFKEFHFDPVLVSDETNTTYKSDLILDFFNNIANQILSLFIDPSNGTIQDLEEFLVTFFTNTDIDLDIPIKDRGFLWYLVFPFYCRAPTNLSCDQGIGTLPGLLYTLVFFGIVAIIFTLVLGGTITSACIMIFAFSFLTVFSGISYFYAFPGCVPQVPECLGYELLEIATIFNDTCIGWPESAITNPPSGQCTPTCKREFLDCKEIGWIDGLDNFIFVLEWLAPDFMASFRASMFFNLFTSWDHLAQTFERFNYQGSPIPPEDFYCFWVNVFNWFQIIFFLQAIALGIFAIAVLIIRFFDRLVLFIVASNTFVTSVSYELEDSQAGDEIYWI